MAAFTIYDLLRHLCQEVRWSTEQDKRVALDSVREWESVSALGHMTNTLECPHENLVGGTCTECGRAIIVGLDGQRRIQTEGYTRQYFR